MPSDHAWHLAGADHTLSCETNVHDELKSRVAGCGASPAATAAGKAAANNSDITRVSASVPDRTAVSNSFSAAFHALTLLDPQRQHRGPDHRTGAAHVLSCRLPPDAPARFSHIGV